MVAFGGPFWLMLVSFWGPFWIILVHLGTLWATLDPLGAPWEERDDLGPPFGAFWCYFWISWGPLGRPLGTPREQEGAQRLSQEGSRQGSKTRPQKLIILDTPWRGSGELSPGREHCFHYFSWLTFGPHFGSILAPLWNPRGPLFSPREPVAWLAGWLTG